MLKQYQRTADGIFNILSAGLIFGVFAGVSWLGSFTGAFNHSVYAQASAVFAMFVFLAMCFRGLSVSERFTSVWQIMGRLADCYGWALLGYAVFLMFFRPVPISRMYFLTSFLFSFLIGGLFHIVARICYDELRKRGLNFRTVLIVGNRVGVARVIQEIQTHKFFGLQILGIVGLEESDSGEVEGYSYVGKIEDMVGVLDRQPVDYVLFVIDQKYPELVVGSAILLCRQRNVDVWVWPDFMSSGLKFSRISYLGEIPFFNFSDDFRYRLLIKRALDGVIAFFLLVLLSVPMFIIGVLIRLTSSGPAVFQQKRVGMNGQLFTMYKFRTMYQHADQKKFTDFLVNDMKGPVFKMKDDPRMTPIGKVLRKHSFDELPQLWNVLVGDMSLVGPRPPLLSEVAVYDGWQRFRLSMRPGITCFWQIMARNKVLDFNEWVALDLKYIDEWSLWLDIKILLKTAIVVFKGTGM